MGKMHAGWAWGAVLASLAAPALAGPGTWTTTGPDGGTVGYLVADPSAPGTLVVAARAGAFRSTDGGDHWQRFENGTAYQFPYGLDVAATGVMFMAPNAVSLVRTSGGASWAPTGLALPTDGYIRDISVRNGSDQHLAVATSAGIFTSADSGASFTHVAGAGLPDVLELVRVDDAGGGRIYAGFSEAIAPATAMVYRSDDGGATFAPTADLPVPYAYLQYLSGDLEAAPTDPDRVYFTASGQVFRSDNGGTSWTACPYLSGYLGNLVVDGGDPDTLWIAHEEGIATSSDGCATWTNHTAGLSADGMRQDVLLSVALAPGFPGDDRVWAASEYGGVYRSDDAGASYNATNTGLISTNIRAIAVHPAVPGQIFAGYGDASSPSATLFRSTDDGASWARANTGLFAINIRGLTVDPTTATYPGGMHLYAVGSSRPTGVMPSPANTDGGIYKSTDGGTTWATIDNGLPNGYYGTRYTGTVRNLALDPRSCAAPPASGPCTSGPLQTAYVTAGGIANHVGGVYTAQRIYKTTNAGATWTAAENGLPPPQAVGSCYQSQIAVPLAIDPSTPSTLYVGLSLTYSTSNPACAVPTMPNGIFKSTDGGATWVHASNGLDRIGGPATSHYSVLALAIDPSNPQVLYAGGFKDVNAFSEGRVFKSTNGGASWSSISVGIAGADVRALLVDPTDPDTVYAGVGGGTLADPSGVYRSTDGGLTWNSFSIGLPADSATALSFDPHTPGRLLAGTVGGLWEFTRVPDPDSDGAASAVEDAAPNAGDANGDGVPDAAQSDVASFNGAAANDGVLRGTLPQVTLEVEPIDGTCARINNAHALPADQLPADTARGVAPALFDRGVLRFELPDCQRANVTVTFHGADASDVDWIWRNYGPLTPGDAGSLAWYSFAGATKLAPDTWRLTLDSAERGNYRASADSILFVGAPGFVDIHLFGDGME